MTGRGLGHYSRSASMEYSPELMLEYACLSV